MRMFMSASFLTLLTSLASGAVIGEWDFNLYDGDANRIKASEGRGLVILGDSWADTALSNPKGSSMNASNDRDAGQSLGLTGEAANGQHLEIQVPAVSGQPLEMSLAMRRSGTGFTKVDVLVSELGVGEFRKITTWSPVEKWGGFQARIPRVRGSNVILRLVLDGATSSRGGVRLDNLVVSTGERSTPEFE